MNNPVLPGNVALSLTGPVIVLEKVVLTVNAGLVVVVPLKSTGPLFVAVKLPAAPVPVTLPAFIVRSVKVSWEPVDETVKVELPMPPCMTRPKLTGVTVSMPRLETGSMTTELVLPPTSTPPLDTWPEIAKVAFCVPGLSADPSTLAPKVVVPSGASPMPDVDDTPSPAESEATCQSTELEPGAAEFCTVAIRLRVPPPAPARNRLLPPKTASAVDKAPTGATAPDVSGTLGAIDSLLVPVPPLINVNGNWPKL